MPKSGDYISRRSRKVHCSGCSIKALSTDLYLGMLLTWFRYFQVMVRVLVLGIDIEDISGALIASRLIISIEFFPNCLLLTGFPSPLVNMTRIPNNQLSANRSPDERPNKAKKKTVLQVSLTPPDQFIQCLRLFSGKYNIMLLRGNGRPQNNPSKGIVNEPLALGSLSTSSIVTSSTKVAF